MDKDDSFDLGVEEEEYDERAIETLKRNSAIQFLSEGMKKLSFQLNCRSDEIRAITLVCVDYFAKLYESNLHSPRKKAKSMKLGILEILE